MATIKAKVWIHIHSQGDGSAVVYFFSTEEAAEKYAEHCDERFSDDIYSEELEFDQDGKLLTPDPIHWRDE
jgi:hypothetical protein